MNESELRRLIESVRRGTLSRRSFVERLAAFGIATPSAWPLLADAGVAQASLSPPPGSSSTFKIAANIGGVSDYDPEPTFVDLMRAFRGFGTAADPLRNTVDRPALDATDRYPTEDFGMTLPRTPFHARAQVLKCKLLGLATIRIAGAPGYAVANVVPSGDDTTFDITVAAGAKPANATMTFTDTKRTAASGTHTGCRGLVIKSDGYSIADTTLFMPRPLTAWQRFSTLRMMDLSAVNNNVHCVTPADRAKDGVRALGVGIHNSYPTISVEDACRLCNAAGKNLWWNIPAAADDALVSEMSTVVKTMLKPGLYCIFELANENWNQTFVQHNYFMDQAMAMVNGYSFQYVGTNRPSTFSRTANFVTCNFELPHNLKPGDEAYIGRLAVMGAPGVKTIASTPTPLSATWAEVGDDRPLQSAARAFVRAGRILLTATRASNIATLHFGKDHGISNGATVKVNGIEGVASSTTVLSVPNSKDITVASTGPDGAIALGGGTSLVADFSSPLNNYDGGFDQFRLARRFYARRTVQVSLLIRAVFGPEFGTRAKVGLFNQPGNGQLDQMQYIEAVHGAPNTFLQGMGKATYIFLDATAFGGSNLRNVSTFKGNTPPSIADYAETLALTADGARTSVKDNYDLTAMVARLYGLKMWQYEFGPDMTGNPVGTAGPAAALQKIDTLFDPLFKPVYRRLLDNMEAHGFEEVACYNADLVPPGSNSEYRSWGVFRDFGSSSVRTDAIDEKVAAARTGATRNLLAPTGITTIDPRFNLGHYDPTGVYPNLGAGNPPQQNWIISSPVDGDYLFTPTFHCVTKATEAKLRINGTIVGAAYPIPLGDSTPAARKITLTRGINTLRFEPGELLLGSFAQATNFSFTKV